MKYYYLNNLFLFTSSLQSCVSSASLSYRGDWCQGNLSVLLFPDFSPRNQLITGDTLQTLIAFLGFGFPWLIAYACYVLPIDCQFIRSLTTTDCLVISSDSLFGSFDCSFNYLPFRCWKSAHTLLSRYSTRVLVLTWLFMMTPHLYSSFRVEETHWPVTGLFLGRLLCLVITSPCPVPSSTIGVGFWPLGLVSNGTMLSHHLLSNISPVCSVLFPCPTC